METLSFSDQTRVHCIDRITKRVQIFFKSEKDSSYSKSLIRKHIVYLIETKGEIVLDNDGELLMLSGHRIADELQRLLEEQTLKAWAEPEIKIYQPGLFEEKESVFNGYRKYSPQKMDAMIVHLAFKGHNLNPTKLNKLLFFSDFSNFRKRNKSISGTEYVALKYGPVYMNYDHEIRILEKKGEVRIKTISSKGNPARIILAKKDYIPEKSILTKEELRILDWVVSEYDKKSTEELVLTSHREDAFWDSHFGEIISYEHARTLLIEPPDSLLDQ